MNASIFWRKFNKDKAVRMSPANVQAVTVEVPEGASLETIIAAGDAVYGGSLIAKGHLGPFEVQTDVGVWYNDERALFSGAKVSGKATFKTWEEMDNEG